MTELSQLHNIVSCKFVVEQRPILFYNKFEYRAKIRIPNMVNSGYCRNLEEFCERNFQISTRWGRTPHPFTESELENIGKFLTWRNYNQETTTVRTDYDVCSIFSNDIALLETLDSVNPEYLVITKVQLQSDPTVKYLDEPKHKYRIYFKEKLATKQSREEIRDLLSNHPSTLFPCKTLAYWAKYVRPVNATGSVTWRYDWVKPFFFIEYDDPCMLTVMQLVLSDTKFGKNYKLEKR